MVPLLALPEGGEWIVLLVIVVLLFGAKKLPELARNSGRALVEFRKAAAGADDDKSVAAQATAAPTPDSDPTGTPDGTVGGPTSTANPPQT
jgi:sec-independent protein translocase protein TatA